MNNTLKQHARTLRLSGLLESLELRLQGPKPTGSPMPSSLSYSSRMRSTFVINGSLTVVIN
jgi:hypothetical protein